MPVAHVPPSHFFLGTDGRADGGADGAVDARAYDAADITAYAFAPDGISDLFSELCRHQGTRLRRADGSAHVLSCVYWNVPANAERGSFFRSMPTAHADGARRGLGTDARAGWGKGDD